MSAQSRRRAVQKTEVEIVKRHQSEKPLDENPAQGIVNEGFHQNQVSTPDQSGVVNKGEHPNSISRIAK